jgi:hypothetical protein
LNEILNVIYAEHIPALLLDFFDAAQLAQGRIPSFLRLQPFCDLLLYQFFQVEV